MALDKQVKDYIRGNLDPSGSTEISDAVEKANDISATAEEVNQAVDKSAQPVRRTLVVDIDFDADGNEQDTGVVLPSSCLIHNAYLNVTTAEDSGTLDVGLDGTTSDDPDGLIDGIDATTEGIIQPTLANGSVTVGELLRVVAGGAGEHAPEPHVVDDEDDANVTITASGAFTTFRGQIYIEITDLSGEPY